VEDPAYPLSIVIPTYNRGQVLMLCLESLERQTFKNFEVVVIDDGGYDTTSELMTTYIRSSSLRVRYFRQKNRGPGSARNRGISLIQGNVCLLIGDDIIASPDLVEKHLHLHQQQPEHCVAGLGLTRWSEKHQEVTPFMEWLDSGGLQFNYGPLLCRKKADWRFFYTSNLSVKTELLRKFPFDESFPYAAMEDMDLACQIESNVGLKVVFLPDATAKHLHPTTFAQACRRMMHVGESTAYFDKKWPGKRKHNGSIFKQILESILIANAWALPIFVKMANWSLRFSCPNYLMRYVLGCCFQMGYSRYDANLRK
jgi:glycosyltransferase involved in cell wall biosynthesis